MTAGASRSGIDRYAVFGHPIKHSKSPQIHSLFAAQTGQQLEYTAIEAPLDGFAQSVADFVADNGKGANVTVPFKEQAFELADSLSERARRAGAVNTLKLQDDGSLYGDTTDGVGLARDLRDNHGIDLAGKSLLLIGAGGAVRGVLEALLAEKPASLLIANRTASKAEQLAEDFHDLGPVQGSGLDAVENAFDIVINGTSASLAGERPDLPDHIFQPGCCAYDMMYAAEATPFLQWSQACGATDNIDGLGMLVEQAAESFHLWRGVRPQTAEVIQIIRRELAG